MGVHIELLYHAMRNRLDAAPFEDPLAHDELLYEFHEAGLWTPDEIHEAVAEYGRRTHMGSWRDLPQKGQDVVIAAIMADRFQQERRGMWGRLRMRNTYPSWEAR